MNDFINMLKFLHMIWATRAQIYQAHKFNRQKEEEKWKTSTVQPEAFCILFQDLHAGKKR